MVILISLEEGEVYTILNDEDLYTVIYSYGWDRYNFYGYLKGSFVAALSLCLTVFRQRNPRSYP